MKAIVVKAISTEAVVMTAVSLLTLLTLFVPPYVG
jgi:hypothetical protein